MIPDANLQYFFSKEALLMNYKTDEMDGVISITDSRRRKDINCCEEGNLDEADRIVEEMAEK